MTSPQNAKATQDFVPIEEVRDGIVMLRGAGMRAVVLASSLNFALKSEDEQNAIIAQFQAFLNSLDFSIQIFVESRRLDIRPYVALLEDRYKKQTADLLKIQIREYMAFIRHFTETVSIMTKTFFVVVPYAPTLIKAAAGIPIAIPSLGKRGGATPEARTLAFEENRTQLQQRVAVVMQGLQRCGVRTAQLGTEEVVELFYKLFNPGETEKPIQVT
ncbi:MAG: hypothetical protein G01um101472_2 [Parcubacteria group bacterium Gr01-1014_72]|nr:MAG: hypothetical protein G01um101472_2 [Parcubacteria group bacterium Gr01-1014_72]